MVQRFLTSSPSLLRPLALLLACLFCFAATGNAADLKLLFMGDNGHHRPEARFQELAPALDARGVQMKYTDRMEDLTADTLGQFDGLVLYANIDRIEDAQAKVVLDYVASGKGFIPLHCATYCWRNNKDIVALMGGQFQRHGGQVFTTQIAAGQHPIMKGYGSFTSWDETYIHHLHNEENRTVLEYRVEGDQAAGNNREPWTWVRAHGKGRVFYTAWGHDERTFNQPGFHNLVERGIRWACGDDPSVVPAFADPDTFAAPPMTTLRQDVAPFEFIEVGPKIPNYTPGKKWGVQGKPKTTMQLPLSPEESMKHFVTPEGLAVRLYADERDFGDSKTTVAAAPSGQSDAIVSAAKRRQDVASGVSPMLASVPSGQRDVIVSAAKRRQDVASGVSPRLASVPSGQNDVVVSTAKRRQAAGSSVSPMLASIPSGQSDVIVSAAKRRQDVASGVSPRSDAHKTTEALKGRHTDSASGLGNHTALNAASRASALGKPIAMNWDERGRLWVCETVDYPNELGGNRDRIRICEDTDHDGRADKFTVFAEGLSIPTAIVIVRGGAVVQNGTETIYLKDTDGDDVSDQKTTLITGWALGDTHGGVSNFRYGLDNWIWSMQGYNNSTPQYDGKTAQSFRMGFWRFKLSQSDPPKVTDLEFVRSSNNNTWGLGISEDGLIFGSTANHNPSMFVPIANRYYESVKGWSPSTLGSIADTYMFDPITENVRQVDQFGGYTAGAGHALYTARTFPQQWWNKTAFVCGPTGHLVGTFVLRRDGANYTSTSPVNLLASDDEWSAPIMAEVGPDGAVWVLDWYNYIVQHNPTPQGFERGKGNAYESDLRDKRHGRIYRIVPTSDDGDTVHEFSSLADVTNKQLVDALKHPSFMWRLHAQRLLIERGANDVVPALLKLLSDDSVDAVGLNVGAIHALHTLKGLGVIDGDKSVAAAPAAVPPFPAAKRRQDVASGVSPGKASPNTHQAPKGRQAFSAFNVAQSTDLSSRENTPAAPSGLDDADVLAAKRRQDVAPGVSPGNVSPNTHRAPKGRQAFLPFNVAESTDLLSRENTPAAPSGLNQNFVPLTPGSRPGLQPVVPSGLVPDFETLTPGLRPGLQAVVPSGLKRRMNRQVNLGGPGMMLVSMPNSAIADDAILIALRNSLAHPSAAVRRNAIAVLPLDEQGLALLLSHQNLFTDNDAQVQLQAFLTLSDMPADKESASPIFRVGPNATDSSLIDAITAAAAVHATKNLSRLTQIVEQSDGVVMTMTSDASKKIAQRVAEHVARSRPDAAMLTAVVNDLRKADAALRNSILDGLTAGLPANFQFVTTDAFDAALVQALKEADSASKSKLVRLGAQCGTKALDAFAEEIVRNLMAVVGDNGASDRNRIAAAKDLVGFRPNDAAIVTQVVGQLNAQTPPQLGVALLLAIQNSKSSAAGQGVVDAMPTLTPLLKSAAIGTLLSRPDWAKSLLAGIERRDIELSDLSLDQKQSLRAFPDKAIRTQAEKLLAMGGGLPDANRDKVLQALMHLCEEEGSVDDGREMFKKHCMKCHKHGQLGDKNIGPNLTGMAVHPKEELLTHIIDPSRSVEGNFRIYTVVDIDGRVKNGMLASETRTSITLIDTEAKETSIQREDIDELVASKKSVMPEGFEKQMTEVELSNLLEFLTNKGKYVPVPLDRYATAISTKGLFSDNDNGPDRMVFGDWSPKMFGEIPFLLTDPMGKSKPNIILLYGPNSPLPASMPKSVTLPCNTAAKTIHLLGGVGGWNHPYNSDKTVSLIVRLHYTDGTHEDHELLNAVHIADYIRKVDVPGSDFAFMLGGQQVRHVAVTPKKTDKIATIELVKGSDRSAPIVMGVTIER